MCRNKTREMFLTSYDKILEIVSERVSTSVREIEQAKKKVVFQMKRNIIEASAIKKFSSHIYDANDTMVRLTQH